MCPSWRRFTKVFKEIGYVEGQNVLIEYRWADLQDDRLPAMAADLVQRRVAVIAATGSTVAATTAKLATTTIPIVFGAGSDPVKEGLVVSLNRPGGNITGVTTFTQQLGAKQLELLHAIVPTTAVVAVLGKRNDPDTELQLKDVEAAARTLGLQILALNVDSKRDFQAAFATLVQREAGALLIFSGPFFTANRVQLAILAARHSVPAIYTLREFPMAGGLMSYAPRLTNSYRQVGIYVGQILKGAKPASMCYVQVFGRRQIIACRFCRRAGRAMRQSTSPSESVLAELGYRRAAGTLAVSQQKVCCRPPSPFRSSLPPASTLLRLALLPASTGQAAMQPG